MKIFFFRRDSTVVAPYERWEFFDPRIKQIEQDQNYAANKTKKVAWFVSNCGARNNRLAYAHELQKHIQVTPFSINSISTQVNLQNCTKISITFLFVLIHVNRLTFTVRVVHFHVHDPDPTIASNF